MSSLAVVASLQRTYLHLARQLISQKISNLRKTTLEENLDCDLMVIRLEKHNYPTLHTLSLSLFLGSNRFCHDLVASLWLRCETQALTFGVKCIFVRNCSHLSAGTPFTAYSSMSIAISFGADKSCSTMRCRSLKVTGPEGCLSIALLSLASSPRFLPQSPLLDSHHSRI